MDSQTLTANLATWADQTFGQSFGIPAILLISITIVLTAIIVVLITRHGNERQRYEFITIIAHKFRTPLTHIKWSAENLLEGGLDSYQKQSFADIRTANENLIKLTGSLIELTDSESGAKAVYKFERIIACDILGEAAAEAKTAFHEKNIFIGVECADPTIAVRADKERLRFVIDAILENACLYSTPGRDVALKLESRDQKAVISITDHGIGFESRDRSRLFTKFFRAKNARSMNVEGFGIGLYLARSIVKQHGGKIKAFSDGVGKGSTFSVILPKVK